MGGAFVEFAALLVDRPFPPDRLGNHLGFSALEASQSWAFSLDWLWQPETKPVGLENQIYERENCK
jgi:hypothetical protein